MHFFIQVVMKIRLLTLASLASLLVLTLPAHIYAANYGDGEYGAGAYNVGQASPTPTPTPTPTASPTTAPSGSSGPKSSSRSPRPAKPSDPTCTAEKPASAPDLFQIDPGADRLTLYFSPSSGQWDRYFVSYGTTSGSEEYGFEFTNSVTGVVSVDVYALQSNTPYYFQVRAGNGCQPGDWSNELAARIGQRFPTFRWSSLPQIVSTGIARQVKPASVQRVEVDSSNPPSVSTEQPPANPTAPTPEPATPPSSEPTVSPSLFSRITGFFKGLFSK